MGPVAETMNGEKKMHEDDGEPWLPVQRERSYTSGSLSGSSGLKRRKQGEAPPNQVPEEKEPSNKRVKPVTKALSATSAPHQTKVTPLKKLSLSIQHSIGSKNDSRLFSFSPRNCNPGSGGKKRGNKLWSETFGNSRELSAREVKRQEVIFEMTQGEHQLIEDLNLVKKNYYEPMLKLEIMSPEELNQIFGIIDTLPPLHQDLLNRLQRLRGEDGTVRQVGPALLDWLPGLHSYDAYCSNQASAKTLLDLKRREPAVHNFLRLCQESAFSRKLDLWSFLDLPRSRLVKYPLLLKEVLRHTGPENPDHAPLSQSVLMVQEIVTHINRKTGEAECDSYRRRLSYLYESQNEGDVSRSNFLHCHGELRNNKGQRLHVFLFEKVLVVTRPVSQNDQLQFQVYRQPIPLLELVLEDLPDGEVRIGGSIRGAFTPTNERAKNFFRVSFRDRTRGQAHTLQANDSFNKQQWVSAIRQAMVASRDHESKQGSPQDLPCTLMNISDLKLSCHEDCTEREDGKRGTGHVHK
ncbi:rho guanine nucleotide exchange factor 3-like isoform X2 [Spea bombifrons]|uniref:rho guanine nucleotide exchange factor 3-like isoform X2 n=1 Tax=Spea bombifrons TaxID=233779 RepID=UPI00234A802A|nr:rho guanine nucleotide exchange factor 3-like isoform X2 [Spea bombifrons]